MLSINCIFVCTRKHNHHYLTKRWYIIGTEPECFYSISQLTSSLIVGSQRLNRERSHLKFVFESLGSDDIVYNLYYHNFRKVYYRKWKIVFIIKCYSTITLSLPTEKHVNTHIHIYVCLCVQLCAFSFVYILFRFLAVVVYGRPSCHNTPALWFLVCITNSPPHSYA